MTEHVFLPQYGRAWVGFSLDSDAGIIISICGSPRGKCRSIRLRKGRAALSNAGKLPIINKFETGNLPFFELKLLAGDYICEVDEIGQQGACLIFQSQQQIHVEPMTNEFELDLERSNSEASSEGSGLPAV